MGSSTPELWTCRLGQIGWSDALAMQEQLRDARQQDLIPDTLLLLEHPPTVTLGRRADESEVPAGRQSLAASGISVYDADRGGRATCHEPGQLVGYPIMHTTDVTTFVRRIENALIEGIAECGVESSTREGLTGVWCEDRKIASIGIHVQRGVTTHGFAINSENNLETFNSVVPCGLPGVVMTSIENEGGDGSLACLRQHIGHAFAGQHKLRQRLVSPGQLGLTDAVIAPSTPCRTKVAA